MFDFPDLEWVGPVAGGAGHTVEVGPITACHHLHSTATVFWAGEAEDGLMPVSEEPDEVEAVVLDTETKTHFI